MGLVQRLSVLSALSIAFAVACDFGLAKAVISQSGQTGKQVDQGLMARANAGDAESQLALANCYESGTCAAQDPDEALVWYRKAAEAGNPTAEFVIASEYCYGSDSEVTPKHGLPKDPVQAATWFRKAAEHASAIDLSMLAVAPPNARSFNLIDRMKGEGAAYFLLGNLFEEGKDLPKDYSQAALWYRRGAAMGQADAEASLGSLYDEGKGVPQDYGQAAVWLRKAAEQGYIDAEVNLATLYFEGHGVVQNYAEARSWLLKAFEKGSTRAAFNLGVIYGKGLGVDQSPSAAYFFFAIAAAGGHGKEQEDATKNRELTGALLTPERITELQKKASEWFAAHPPTEATQ